jgi:hypothetical protein
LSVMASRQGCHDQAQVSRHRSEKNDFMMACHLTNESSHVTLPDNIGNIIV